MRGYSSDSHRKLVERLRAAREAQEEASERDLIAFTLELQEYLMGITDALAAAITDLEGKEQTLTDAVTAADSELSTLATDVANLQQQINSGATITAEDLQPLADRITAVGGSISSAGSALSAATSAAEAPAASGAAAPASGDPAAAPTGDAGAAAAPAPTGDAAPAASGPTQTVYTFSGDQSQIDPNAWPASGFETAEAPARVLYYYSQDTAPGDAKSDGLVNGDGTWSKYDGPTQPVAAA